jgi:hypothetical protein
MVTTMAHWLKQQIPAHERMEQQLTRVEREAGAQLQALGLPVVTGRSWAVEVAVKALYDRLIERGETLAEAEYLRAAETYADITSGNRQVYHIHLKQATVTLLDALGAYVVARFPNTPYLRGGSNRRVLIVFALFLYRVDGR